MPLSEMFLNMITHAGSIPLSPGAVGALGVAGEAAVQPDAQPRLAELDEAPVLPFVATPREAPAIVVAAAVVAVIEAAAAAAVAVVAAAAAARTTGSSQLRSHQERKPLCLLPHPASLDLEKKHPPPSLPAGKEGLSLPPVRPTA